jgi:hypothetical protein
MKKFLGVVGIIVLCLSLVGWKGQGGWKADNQWSGNLYFKTNVVATGHKEGVTLNVSGETNLTSAALAYGVIKLADTGALTGADTRYIALANGIKGQMVTIQLVAATAGTLYITDDYVSSGVFPMTKTGWDDIAFDAALDSVTLLYVDDVIGWVVIGGNSVTIT